MSYEDPPRTKRTLLSRLRNLDDHESWRRFFELYWQLLYNVARKSGLEDDAAQDVVQETVISVARAMPDFRYDPARGSFKQWLMRIVRRRIMDQWRKNYRQPPRSEVSLECLEEDARESEALIDHNGHPFENAWNLEWERSVFDAAVAEVRQVVQPKHFQVFDFCVLKGWETSKVAQTLGLSSAQVYLAKHRVGQAVKRAIRDINARRMLGQWDEN